MKTLLCSALLAVVLPASADIITFNFIPREWRATHWVDEEQNGSQTLVDYVNPPLPMGLLVIDTSNPGVAAPGSIFDPDGPTGPDGLANHDPVELDGSTFELHVAQIAWPDGAPLPLLDQQPVWPRSLYWHFLRENTDPEVPGRQLAFGSHDGTGYLNTWGTGDWVSSEQVPDAGSSALLLFAGLAVLGACTWRRA